MQTFGTGLGNFIDQIGIDYQDENNEGDDLAPLAPLNVPNGVYMETIKSYISATFGIDQNGNLWVWGSLPSCSDSQMETWFPRVFESESGDYQKP